MLDTRDEVTVLGPEAGERLDVFGATMVVKSDGSRNGLYVAENPIPPGYLVPPHIHDEADEAFYILQGELTLISAAGESKAGPGSCVLLPRGEMHGFRNDTAGMVRFLVISLPGPQAAEMFRHLDRATRAAAGALPPPEIGAITAQYGVRLL